ncbi:MAG: hypothetical protein ACK5MA_00395 [Parachlamydiaceae bacterium]
MRINLFTNRYDSRAEKWESKRTRLEIKASFYAIISKALQWLSSDKAAYFEFKHRRTLHKISSANKKERLGTSVALGALNIVQTSVIKKGTGVKAVNYLSQQLKEKKNQIEKKLGLTFKLNEEPDQTQRKEALCYGAGLDIATRFLNGDQLLTEILPSLEKGASAEAYANQMLFEMLQPTSLAKNALELVQERLKRLGKVVSEDDLKKMISEAVQKINIGEKGSLFPFPTLGGVRLTGDPFASNLILDIIYNRHEPKKAIVAAARGVELTSTEETMGSHFQFKTDEEYLNKLKELKDGCYYIRIAGIEVSHVLTFIRLKGTDILIDPNGVQMVSHDPQETKANLIKILGSYTPPPSENPQNVNHRLEIFKYEKLKGVEQRQM